MVAFAFGQRAFLKRDMEVVERRGARLGALWFRIDKKHRTRALSNIEMAFPEWTPEQRLEIAEGAFRHFGIVAGDFLRSPLRTKGEIDAAMEVQGLENLEAAEALGKGVLAITGHLGNWERLAHWMSGMGRSVSVVARDADDTGLNERMLRIREGTGVEVLSRGNSARLILSRLKKGNVIGILPDQNSAETFVPFFGMPCGTVKGPAIIHRRTGAPLLPCFCLRTGVGQYRLEILPMIDTSGMADDADAITAAVNMSLETVIRRHPDQWLWMHDRWKSARKRGLL